jgi:hypothetical protein
MKQPWLTKGIIGIIIVLAGSACQKQNYYESPFPRVLTTGVSEVGPGGARFHGEMIKEGEEAVVDHGFYWSLGRTPSAGTRQQISLGPLDKASAFDAFVDFALPEGKKIYVWAYLKTNDLEVYGNARSFTSEGCNPPEIISVDPQPATYLEEISIHGRYFGTNEKLASITLKTDAQVTFFSDTLIRFQVPIAVDKQVSDLILDIMGQEVTVPFEIYPPQIHSLSRKVLPRKDTLDIFGEYFNPNTYFQVVRMDGHTCKRVFSEPNTIRIIVPEDLDTARYYRIEVVVGEMSAVSKDSVFVPH